MKRMRNPFLGLLTLVSGSLALAQTSPELGPGNVGFVRVMNAVGTDAPTLIDVGPVKLMRGREVAPGDSSGNLSLTAGDYTLAVRNEACVPSVFRAPFTVTGGQTLAMVIYTQLEEKEDELVPVIDFARFSKGAETARPKFSAVSLSSQPEVRVQIRDDVIGLRPKTPRSFDVEPFETVSVQIPGMEPTSVEVGDNGHYIMFVFDDAETGALDFSVLPHLKIAIDFGNSGSGSNAQTLE